MKKINQKVLFGKNVDLEIEVSTSEELAKDRAVEFEAYNDHLSRINPYMRLSEAEQSRYNAYNDFGEKLKEIKKMRKINNVVDNDEYYVRSYYPRPESEKEENLFISGW